MNKMEWIAFNEKKPRPFSFVIVQREFKNQVTAAYYQSCPEYGDKNEFSIEEGGNLRFSDVVYWMELPQGRV